MTILYFSSKVASLVEGNTYTDSPRLNDHFHELVVCKIERLRAEPVKLMRITNHSDWKLIKVILQVIALQTDK